HKLGVREQVGDFGRDRGKRGVQDPRQAQQRGMHVNRGQRRAFQQQSINTWASVQQPGQRLGAPYEHSAAVPFYERRVANELQRIAQSLLGVQQDGASSQGRSIPQRLRQRSAAKRFALPAPFILRPSLLVVA